MLRRLTMLLVIPLLAACGGTTPSSTTSSTAAATAAPGEGALNIVAWEGYVDKSWTDSFVAQTGCKVNKVYAGSSDEMFTKFQAGGGSTYDLVSASGDASLRFINSGVVQPVDLTKLTNYNDLIPALQGPPHNTVGGKHYGVSFMWGPDPLIYDTRAFPTPPTSWSVIYDPANAGKITIPDNPIQIADAALYLGFPDPYELNADQMAQVKALLLKQRPLVRKFWGSAGDFVDLFKNGEATAGAGWSLMTQQLKAANFPVGETIPKEGATGWADTWMLSSHAQHPVCAYKWMNYMTSPAVQAQVITITAYSPANLKTCAVTGVDCVALHVSDPAYFASLKFWKTPSNYADWQTLWNTVKG